MNNVITHTPLQGSSHSRGTRGTRAAVSSAECVSAWRRIHVHTTMRRVRGRHVLLSECSVRLPTALHVGPFVVRDRRLCLSFGIQSRRQSQLFTVCFRGVLCERRSFFVRRHQRKHGVGTDVDAGKRLRVCRWFHVGRKSVPALCARCVQGKRRQRGMHAVSSWHV